VPLTVPLGTLYVKTLDASGLGGIVLNAGGALTGGGPTPSCSMSGSSRTNAPDTWGTNGTGSAIVLGPSLNRPLIYIGPAASTSYWSDLYLSGNRANQSGWAGGPNGKLYVMQIADYASPAVETAINLHRVVIRDGYNGALYLGSGRGSLWSRDSWFSYSGQSTADFAVLLNGYDATFQNFGIGSNAGTGLFIAEGAQYQFTDGAIWMNGLDGVRINGSQVQYSTFSGTNIQANGCNGINVLSQAPYSGQVGGGHVYTGLTFDGNSATATGTCSDFLITDSQIENIISPVFLGSASTTGNKPKYSVNLAGSGSAWIIAPQFGTGTPYTTAFTTNFASLRGSYNLQATWTPALAGSVTAGSPTYTTRAGSWSRNNNEITAHFNVAATSLGGAAGNLTITGLPFWNSAATNEVGTCAVSTVQGWTADAGYYWLTGIVGNNSTAIYLYENGSGKAGQTTPVSNFGATLLEGVCIYHTDS
jgi:hypothetical protein